MNKVEMLAQDFQTWGRERIEKVAAGVEKWGFIVGYWFTGDLKKG